MSAYIVNDLTINRIVSYLMRDRDRLPFIKDDLAEANIDLNELGQAMLDLNRRAVDYRYSESNEASVLVPATVPVTRIQALKSLRCWLYQCSEGNIPEEEELFKIMESYSGALAYAIVRTLPEFEQAEWG